MPRNTNVAAMNSHRYSATHPERSELPRPTPARIKPICHTHKRGTAALRTAPERTTYLFMYVLLSPDRLFYLDSSGTGHS